MRIRTLKPEFWAHETLSRLPHFTRLMAIGLLNLADDEGYFYANPILIRAALFPFVDDSGTIRGAVGELSGIGYIRIGIDQEGREVGHVVNFSKHQKGDKFKTSKLKELATFPDSSPTVPLPIPDSSPLEQGTGNREQGTGKASKPRPSASDSEWMEQLQTAEAYRHLDVKRELSKAEVWCKTNSRQCTRRFFTNWLNRASSDTRTISTASAPERQMTADDRAEQERRKAACDKAAREQAEELHRMLVEANRPPCAPGELEEIF